MAREQLSGYLSAPAESAFGLCLRLIKEKDSPFGDREKLLRELIMARLGLFAMQKYAKGTNVEMLQMLSFASARLQSYDREQQMAYKLWQQQNGILVPANLSPNGSSGNGASGTNGKRA